MIAAGFVSNQPSPTLHPVRPAAAFVVAVVGNPNTGKSTLFNALTGLSQRVGNYPGVTVEHKSGWLQLDDGTRVELIDLPGTYSLAARSPDEMIVADALLGQQAGLGRVDAVLAIADASSPERNFYLVSQLCELELPVVVALNMMDVAERKGIGVDVGKISAALGTPVVGVCASKGTGIPQLRAALRQALSEKRSPSAPRVELPASVRTETAALLEELHTNAPLLKREVGCVEAFRILVDKGGYAEQRVAKTLGEGFRGRLTACRLRASSNPLPAEEVRARYAWVKRVLNGAVTRPAKPLPTGSDKIDRVLTHWASGTVVFALVMLLLFQSIFYWAHPLMRLISGACEALGSFVGRHLAEGALKSLLCDGVIAGVGGVLVFLPQICILFLFIAILEDCGYMARAAFLMDRLLFFTGLSGKSFIPMLSSFACAVPGIMASRTIEHRRDRLATMLVSPLMSCSARLPVYAIMIGAFIPDTPCAGGWLSLRGVTLFAMYGVGLAVAVPVAWILKKTLLKGATPPFLFELPSYKLPAWRGVVLRVFDRGKDFVVRAGTIILSVSIIVWALSYFPHPPEIAQRHAEARAEVGRDGTLSEEQRAARSAALERAESGEYLRQSWFGRAGRAVEPVFRPMGWDWRISMSVLASFPAREVIVATLGTVFSADEVARTESGDQYAALRNVTWSGTDRRLFTIPVALSLMVFFALCSQCAATLATIKRETNSWRWPLFAFTYMTALAYGGALITYQATAWLGWGSVL